MKKCEHFLLTANNTVSYDVVNLPLYWLGSPISHMTISHMIWRISSLPKNQTV